jgi:hypothetical protein
MLAVFCADIGSVKAGNFGWYGGAPGAEGPGNDPATLADAVARQLRTAHAVALGFECPLFVPLCPDPSGLTAARDGEAARPWSAAAGATALATGLTQVAWILRRIRAETHAPAFLKWDDFQHARSGLFLWEAFVSGAAKGNDHPDDARKAVAAFQAALPDPTRHNAVSVREAYSLIGAALLRTGWKTNPAVLSTPALVIGVPRGPQAIR